MVLFFFFLQPQKQTEDFFFSQRHFENYALSLGADEKLFHSGRLLWFDSGICGARVCCGARVWQRR